MKKTTPALIATFLITTILGGGMFLIGIDATRSTTTTAAVPQGIVNIHTSNVQPTTTTTQSATSQTSITRTVLRTGGS